MNTHCERSSFCPDVVPPPSPLSAPSPLPSTLCAPSPPELVAIGAERGRTESREWTESSGGRERLDLVDGHAEMAVSRRLTASVNMCHVSPTGGTHLSDSLFSGLKRRISAPRYRLASLLVVFYELPIMWYRSVTLTHNVVV